MSDAEPPVKRFKLSPGAELIENVKKSQNWDLLNNRASEESRREAPKPVEDNKVAAYKTIIVSWYLIGVELGLPDSAMCDLFVSCEISTLLCASLKMILQEKGQFKAKNEGKDSTVTYKGKAYNILNKTCNNIVETVYTKYKPSGDSKGYRGCLQPLAYYTCLFKERFRSYRVTTTTRQVGQSENPREGTREFSLSKMGIKPAHVVFTDGMRMAPYLASSMAQAIGPATVLFNVIFSPTEYAGKWVKAAKKQLGHISGMNAAIDFLKGRRQDDIKPIVNLMLDVALGITPRQTHKAAIPVCMLIEVMLNAQLKFSSMYDKEFKTDLDIWAAMENVVKFNTKAMTMFNSSGPQLGPILNKIFSESYTIPKVKNQDHGVKHSILSLLGAAKEDLSIMSWMFGNQKFYKRSEIGDSFEQMGHQKETTSLEFPKVKYWSRMAQASMSGMQAGTSSQQVSSVPVFAGKRKRNSGEELLAYLEASTNSQESFSSGKEGIISTLTNVKKTIIEKLKSKNEVIGGTISWGTPKNWDQLTSAARMDTDQEEDKIAADLYLTPVAVIPDERGIFFYQ